MGDLKRIVLPLMLLGDGQVGKTSLILRLIENELMQERIKYSLNKYAWILIKNEKWDAAGKERFKSMLVKAIKNTDAVILVNAIND